MNVEQIVSEKLMAELERVYTKDRKRLLTYLIGRYILEKKQRKIGKGFPKLFMSYLMDFMGIVDPAYKGEVLFYGRNHENSLTNIFLAWLEKEGFVLDELYEEALSLVRPMMRRSYMENFRYLRDAEKENIILYGAITYLEEELDMLPKVRVLPIEGFDYVKGYLRYPDATEIYNRLTRNSPHRPDMPAEEEIRKFILHHPSGLEEGLKIRAINQPIQMESIDFIARDENGCLVIIQLMNPDNPSPIIYNNQPFRRELEKIYKADGSRLILLYYKRDPYAENFVTDAEIHEYTPVLRRGRLIDITYRKLQE